MWIIATLDETKPETMLTAAGWWHRGLNILSWSLNADPIADIAGQVTIY